MFFNMVLQYTGDILFGLWLIYFYGYDLSAAVMLSLTALAFHMLAPILLDAVLPK